MAVMANLSFIERQRFNLVEGKVKENGQMFTLAVHRVMVLSGCQQQLEQGRWNR